MRTRIGFSTIVLSCIATVALFAAGSKVPVSLDQVITLTAGETTSVKLPAGSLVVEEFVIGNLPEAQDIERSKSHPDDKFYPRIQVAYSNPGTAKMKVTCTAALTDDAGAVLFQCTGDDTIEPGAKSDHTRLCMMTRMKIRDFLKATKVHLVIMVSPA
jgi:hypothetical protein